jgi:hypothetical protein
MRANRSPRPKQRFAREPFGRIFLYRKGSSSGMKFVSIGIFNIARDSSTTSV